ncbi:hypothetical protein MMC18_007532 [Xylographa bjoerkii]|nr:hypothetical protein [Xylographa bjoerkii]
MYTSRYQLVDSLYGPGTVGAWLLTLCAVLISWTLNASSRRKDTISIDFIAALLLPMVAASHLVVQIARLPFSVAEVITAQDVEVQKYASAMAAPLNVCETFSIAGLLLAVCCGPWWSSDPKRKRLGLLLFMKLISSGAEKVMFAMATRRGVHLVDAALRTPYMFLLTPFVASTWGYLALCGAVGGAVLVIGRGNALRAHDIERDPERTRWRCAWSYPLRVPNDKNNSGRTTEGSGQQIKAQSDRATPESRTSEHESRSIMSMTAVTTFLLPVLFTASTSMFGLSPSEPKDSSETYSKQFFLMPKSNGSMSDLDQILALAGGTIALLAAVRRAYRSRVDGEQTSEKVIQ